MAGLKAGNVEHPFQIDLEDMMASAFALSEVGNQVLAERLE
jgi:hypothetical protein